MEVSQHVGIIKWIKGGVSLYASSPVLIFLVVVCALTASVITLGVLLGPMLAGVYLVLFRLIQRKEERISNLTILQEEEYPLTGGDVFQGFEYCKQTMLVCVPLIIFFAIAGIVCSRGAWLGFIVLLMLTVIVGSLSLFVIPLMVEKNLMASQALLRSANLVLSSGFSLVVLYLVVSFVSVLTLVFIWTGIIFGRAILLMVSPIFLVTVPVYFCVVAVAYNDLYRMQK